MGLRNNIVWREGMFLRQHHFQQFNRYQDYKYLNMLKYTLPESYGIENIDINYDYLEQGIISIDAVKCIFQNGTVYDAPNMDSLPPLYTFKTEKTSMMIYIGILNENIADNADTQRKYQSYKYEYYDARDDLNHDNEQCEVEIKKVQAYILSDEDDLSNFYVIPILKINEVKANLNIILNKSYISPYIITNPGDKIYNYLDEIYKLLKSRAEILNNRLSNNNTSESVMISDFMMLQLINLYLVKIADIFNLKRIFTYQIYTLLSELLSQIIIYTHQDRVVDNAIKYHHLNLEQTFYAIISQLKHSLSMILEQHAKSLPIVNKNHGLYTIDNIKNYLFDDQIIILSIYANLPVEELKNKIINQIKIAPLADIKSLVSKGLAGVPLKTLPAAPRQIPSHANYIYLEVDIDSAMWQQILKEDALSIHVSVKYDDFRMELWTVRI